MMVINFFLSWYLLGVLSFIAGEVIFERKFDWNSALLTFTVGGAGGLITFSILSLALRDALWPEVVKKLKKMYSKWTS